MYTIIIIIIIIIILIINAIKALQYHCSLNHPVKIYFRHSLYNLSKYLSRPG
uniref:Uncharacterized protein n=1 Tax=Amphimedon queenslandica TaxID=400682 RepID=A0A1X7T3F7_AMPQE